MEHQQNSERLQRAIAGYALAHPLGTLSGVGRRVLRLLSAPTAIYDYKPQHAGLWLYRLVVWLAAAMLAARVIRLLATFHRRPLAMADEPHNQVALIALLSTVLLASGEAQEEARLVITVLPMLAIVLAAEAAELCRDFAFDLRGRPRAQGQAVPTH